MNKTEQDGTRPNKTEQDGTLGRNEWDGKLGRLSARFAGEPVYSHAFEGQEVKKQTGVTLGI
jgi:hypothetical protein